MSEEKPKTDTKPKRRGGPNPGMIIGSVQSMLPKVMPQLIDASDIVESIGPAAEKMYRQLTELGLPKEIVVKMVDRHLQTMYYLLIFQEMFTTITKQLSFTAKPPSKPQETG